MPLHSRRTIRSQLYESIFASVDLRHELPKYRFPVALTHPDIAFQVVHDELLLDGNARQNLATFCQTWEEPQVHALMDVAIDKNLIDQDEYPQTSEIERRCVHMVADLWNAPDAEDTVGTSTIGSSEAAMLAGMAALRRWRARQKKERKPLGNPNMVCGPVQVVWHKFARYWDIELREMPMAPGRYGLTPDEMAARVDENTIFVVPTLGVTYTGMYEPVADLATRLDELQEKTGIDVDIHVDAASGGFLAPFCAPDLLFDFRIPRVKSINASGHKFGLAPLGAGWVVWRDERELPEELVFHVNYLGGDMPDFHLNFSRPAGQVIAQYYNFIRLGREGYQGIHGACYETGAYIADQLPRLGPFELLAASDPSSGIPAVTWRIADGETPGYTLLDLADRLRNRGWQVPAYTLTGDASNITVQRVLIRQGVDRDLASLLVDDVHAAVEHFDRHPVSVGMTSKEAGGFSHL